MTHPDPPANPDLAAAFAHVGEPTDEYRPATGNVVAWLIVWGGLGLASLAGLGVVVAVLVERAFGLAILGGPPTKRSSVELVLVAAGAACSLGLAVLLLRSAWRDFAGRVFACPGGFVHLRRRRVEVFRWEDVQKVVQDYVDANRYPPKDGGPPLAKGTTILVTRADGHTFGFGEDVIKGHRKFARWLFAETQDRGIPWDFFVPT